jgi:predicted RNA-binding Zn-ribbon protein involved in translation (DUF1610 family)
MIGDRGLRSPRSRTIEVLEVYAGGHVVCQSCGSSVAVPLDDGFVDEKFRFHCPHCETRVLARKASAGKKSECPACGKVYVIPDPPLVDTTPEVTPPSVEDERRIKIDTDELMLRFGLPFPVGKLEKTIPAAPQPRYLHRADQQPDEPQATPDEALPRDQSSVAAHVPASPPSVSTTHRAPPGPQPPVLGGLTAQDPRSFDEERVGIDSSVFARGSNLAVTRAAIPQMPSIPSPIPSMPSPVKPASSGELQVLTGNCSGQRIRMTFRRFVVGTERDCDLRAASALLSRHHCVFKKDEYALRIRDLGSNNGTYVNGRRICGEVVLNPGDDVTIGDMTVHVILPFSPRVMQMAADSNPSISDFVIL